MSGRRGAAEDQWLYEHAGQEQTAAHFEGIWRGADTALLGAAVFCIAGSDCESRCACVTVS